MKQVEITEKIMDENKEMYAYYKIFFRVWYLNSTGSYLLLVIFILSLTVSEDQFV